MHEGRFGTFQSAGTHLFQHLLFRRPALLRRLQRRLRLACRRVRPDRRVAERRLKDTWADDPEKQSRRSAERRVLSRRSGKDRRKEIASKPKTFVHELVTTSGAGVQTLPPQTPLRDAIAILAIHKIGLIVVTSTEKGLVGVLSERDIIQAFHDLGAAALESQVSVHMTRGIWTCSPNDRLTKIMSTMNEHKMRHMPVVKDGALLGVISASDLLKAVPTS